MLAHEEELLSMCQIHGHIFQELEFRSEMSVIETNIKIFAEINREIKYFLMKNKAEFFACLSRKFASYQWILCWNFNEFNELNYNHNILKKLY